MRKLVVTVEQGRGLSVLLRRSDRLLDLLAASPVEMVLDLGDTLVSRRTLGRLLRDLRPYGTRIRLVADSTVLRDPRLEVWRFDYRLPEPPTGPRRLPAPAV